MDSLQDITSVNKVLEICTLPQDPIRKSPVDFIIVGPIHHHKIRSSLDFIITLSSWVLYITTRSYLHETLSPWELHMNTFVCLLQ